ncbi:MAG: hypothetical protein ACHQ50_04460 [Fimbriimonadales bacterium]
MDETDPLTIIPGGDLVRKGLADLKKGLLTEEGLLVLIAKKRLEGFGLMVPVPEDVPKPYEHTLYSLVEWRDPKRARFAYNALIRRIVSFTDSYSRFLHFSR